MAAEDKKRVAMYWPAELQERVREKVGQRGLTEFTLQAVRAKLGEPEPTVDEGQLNEAQEVAQRLADALAMGGDYEDRQSQLRLMELPAWISTEGWPDDLAGIVPLEEPVAEPITHEVAPEAEEVEQEPDPAPEEAEPEIPQHPTDSDLHKPMFMSGRDQGMTDVPTPIAPVGSKADDLLDRIKAKAAEKGVDVSGLKLKPASEVEQPEPKPEPEPIDVTGLVELQDEPDAATKPAPDLEVPAPTPSELQAAPELGVQTGVEFCPNGCGSELVDGECWTCF